MTQKSENEDERGYLTNWEAVHLHKTMMEKLFEFAIREIDDDLGSIEEKTLREQLEIRAYWMRYIDLYFAFTKRMDEYKDPEKRFELVLEIFGEQTGIPSKALTPDLTRRLQWFKSRVAKDFEREVASAIDGHSVESPIEQIFLMQWHYVKRHRAHEFTLKPQNEIDTGSKKYAVDFLVGFPSSNLKLAVELDGHDFHEKTKEQVARDKRREREITAQGFTILRFSGFEVVKNVGSVVDEVLKCAHNILDDKGT